MLLAPLLGSITIQFGWKASYIFLGLLVWVVALPVINFVIKGSPAELGLPPDGDGLEPPSKEEGETGEGEREEEE